MNESMRVRLYVLDASGNENPLMMLDIPLDNQYTNLVQTLNQIKRMQDHQRIQLVITPVNAQGVPAASGESVHQWTVSSVLRHSGGGMSSEQIMAFKKEAAANQFAQNLMKAFSENRNIQIQSPDAPLPCSEKTSAEIINMIPPQKTQGRRTTPSAGNSPSPFSPGA